MPFAVNVLFVVYAFIGGTLFNAMMISHWHREPDVSKLETCVYKCLQRVTHDTHYAGLPWIWYLVTDMRQYIMYVNSMTYMMIENQPYKMLFCMGIVAMVMKKVMKKCNTMALRNAMVLGAVRVVVRVTTNVVRAADFLIKRLIQVYNGRDLVDVRLGLARGNIHRAAAAAILLTGND